MEGEFNVEFIEQQDRSARFLVRGVTPAVANGIRRAMVADVPTFSVDDVRFVENSSVMFDEMIALRLGLVPLTTPATGFEIGDVVTLSLDIRGPQTAYSGDIVTSEPLVEPAEENVPIIELKENQRLELEADAVLERGKKHAKQQGGVAVGYRHLQRIEVIGERDEFADEGPEIIRGVIEEGAPEAAADESATEGELIITDDFDNDLRNRYPGKDVAVTDVSGAVVFHVETDGSFSVAELVQRAAESISERAAELETKVAV
jgi:DNA-directed RNA polymerase subunit D